MEKMNKEFALHNFLEMIKQSWTWGRLTEDEKERYLEAVDWACSQGAISGTYSERWKVLQLQYHTFLLALEYQSTGWREK